MRIDKTHGEYLSPAEYDAVNIEAWLKFREHQPAIANSIDPDYIWCHENPEAWPLVRIPDGLSESSAKALMAMAQVAEEGSPAPQEPRFNPNHDPASGKFTSKGGGGMSAATQLGSSSFYELDHRAAVEEQFQINERNYPDAPASANKALAERWIREDTRVFASGADRMYVKGHANVTDENLASFAKDFDEMKTRFPLKHPAVISVEGASRVRDKQTGRQVLAETTIAGDRTSATFRFSDNVVNNTVVIPKRDFHPAGYYVDARRNVVAHEYGHAYMKEPLSVQNKQFFDAHKDGLSNYGKSNVWEGYAEAFSDYIMGPPEKWMPATKSYRFKYGWAD